MIRVGILTFHFAYNYGAMLQAYALRCYLSNIYNVELINYQPVNTRKTYSTNPFAYGMHPRLIVQRIKNWPVRKKQAKVFESFKRNLLGVFEKPFSSLDELKYELQHHEINVFGSDQIWNLSITGETPEYYGALCDTDNCNIVYAGSFGHDKLSEKEKDYLKHLTIFDNISVREIYSQEMLNENGIDSFHVCDPVFLIELDNWNSIIRKPVGLDNDRFILFYTLKYDETLIRNAQEIANKLEVKLISIHPNANKIGVGKQLFGIGPQEFLWLIKNSEYVFTNSFHASAFSLIFKKKLIHSQFEQGRGRVQSLLDIVSAVNVEDCNGIECIDFSTIDESKLSDYVNKSKEYLKTIYEKKENN